MRNDIRQLVLMAAAAFAVRTVLAAGLSGTVLSNAELLRSSGNVTGSGFGSSSASFELSSGSVGVLDWRTLNVGAGESLKFGNGIWYNAVTGSDASYIAGSILGSGANVYVFNPNGVFFSSGSHIDVGSFTAAGFEMTNLDDMIADPTCEPVFAKNVLGDIDAMHAKFGSERVELYGRSVFVEESSFAGSLSIVAGAKVAVDSVGGGTVSFKFSGSSGDASFVNSSAAEVKINAMGNARIESSGDLAIEDVSAGKNVSVVSDGALTVAGRVAAKKNVYVEAGKDVTWTKDGILRADGNVHVESTSGNVELGSISAKKASVTTAGDVTGWLGASGYVLENKEKACATYRIDADGTVVVSFESATVDVRGRKGVTLNADESLTIAPVAVSTVILDPGTDKQGRPALLESKVDDAAIGGYQSPETDVEISAPKNLAVNGTIETLGDDGPVVPDTIRLVAEDGNVSVGGRVSAKKEVLLEAGHDIVVTGSVASDGKLGLTAGNAVALGENRNPLVSKDITITVDANGNPTIYEGASEDGVLVLNRTKKGTNGKLTSAGTILLIDGSVAGGEPAKVAMMQELEAVSADGNSALPVRDPHAALSASPFNPADINAQLPGATNEVVHDESALMRASKEEEPWMLKNMRK